MTARGLLLAAGATALLLLAGCRAEEQNRPIEFKKGTYVGKPDEALTEAQLKALRERADQAR